MVATTITCPRCARTSHNPNDVRERYCGGCHRYHDDAANEDDLRALSAELDCTVDEARKLATVGARLGLEPWRLGTFAQAFTELGRMMQVSTPGDVSGIADALADHIRSTRPIRMLRSTCLGPDDPVVARSKASGRGFTGDLNIIDEAWWECGPALVVDGKVTVAGPPVREWTFVDAVDVCPFVYHRAGFRFTGSTLAVGIITYSRPTR